MYSWNMEMEGVMAPYKKVYKDLQKKTNQWKITFFFHMVLNLPLHLALCIIWWLWLPSDGNISNITISVNMKVFLCSHLSSILVPQLSVTSPHNCVLFPCLYIVVCLSHAACYLEAAGLPWIHLHTAPIYYTTILFATHIQSTIYPYILKSNLHPNLIRTSFCRFLKRKKI